MAPAAAPRRGRRPGPNTRSRCRGARVATPRIRCAAPRAPRRPVHRRGEVGAEQVELGLERADPDTEDQAAPAHHVERAVTLGDLEWVVVAEHQHMRREANAFGAGREVAERRERVVVAAAAHGRDVGGDRDVLAAGEVVVAERVRRARDRDDIAEAGGLLPCGMGTRKHREHRCDDAQLQTHLSNVTPRSASSRRRPLRGCRTGRHGDRSTLRAFAALGARWRSRAALPCSSLRYGFASSPWRPVLTNEHRDHAQRRRNTANKEKRQGKKRWAGLGGGGGTSEAPARQEL